MRLSVEAIEKANRFHDWLKSKSAILAT